MTSCNNHSPAIIPIEFTASEIIGAFDFRNGTYVDVSRDIAVYVNARLSKLFDGAVEVYGDPDLPQNYWNQIQTEEDTHRAILLKPEPIKRGVTKEEIIKILRDKTAVNWVQFSEELADRIEKEGIV